MILIFHFSVENVKIHALNIVFELFTRTIPTHSHGNHCYEIHYIPAGYGKLVANGQYYDISPNTLFVTGPHIEHAQTPLQSDPMQEYCVYLKIRSQSAGTKNTPVISAFYLCSLLDWQGYPGNRCPDETAFL